MKRWTLGTVFLGFGGVVSGCEGGQPALTPTAVQTATAATAATPTATVPPELAHAVEFRKAKGLSYDLDHVRTVETDLASVDWSGVKLTIEESLALERSEGERSVGIGTLNERVQAMPGFAGFWVEQPAGMVAIAATDIAPFEAIIPYYPWFEIRVVPARYTYAELRALQDQVSADAVSGALGDVKMTMCGVDVKANVVHLGVNGLTYEQRVFLLAKYGPRLVVEESEFATHR